MSKSRRNSEMNRRKFFVAAGANSRDPENLDPDVLYPLADAVSVRRR